MELFECSDGSLINPDFIEECVIESRGTEVRGALIFRFSSGRTKSIEERALGDAKAEMKAYRDHVTNFYADPFIDMLSLDGPAGSRH